MESLAAIFVGLVTFINTAAPTSQAIKLLSWNPLSPTQAVLSEMDETNTTTATGTARGEKIRSLIEKRNLERAEKIDALKARRQENVNERTQKRQEFKEKLAEIKDERKKALTEKIDSNLAQLNIKWVTKWNEVLTRLSAIIVKIETRTQAAHENGKDTASVEAAITDAKAAVDTAQAAVTAQSEKTYTMTLSSESNLGQDVRATINTFHNDIKNTRDTVEEARKSVMAILPLLKGMTSDKPEVSP